VAIDTETSIYFNIDIQEEGSSIASISGTGVRSTLDFVVADPGLIKVNLTGYVYEPVDFDVSLTSAE
jgi:hypothetical protein